MQATNPSKANVHYLTLGQACHACGLKPHVVRYWESQIPALKPAKNRGTRRLYSPPEVNTLLRVKQWVLVQGASLEQVITLLPPPPNSPNQRLAIIKELEGIVELLKSQ